MTFVGDLSKFLAAQGWDTTVPLLLQQWAELIQACKDGYQWDISEYHHELQVRNRLERVMSAPELAAFSEMAIVRQKVEALDQDFRDLLQAEVVLGEENAPWWEQGVLKYAGEPYACYIRQVLGVEVIPAGT